ncbi:MAG TPA: ATP-binding cassette domain-containing protein, partial [Anaerolineaceae bacterium]|nr:ATP-binding cassette domain-containing protein [Anaerolineaceae bacterium]
MPLLTAANLSKSYGALDIFPEISFSIPHRARIGLVGANGVGKTTLLRVLMGEEEPSSGTIH